MPRFLRRSFLALAIATLFSGNAALADPPHVTKFAEAVQHYNKAVTIVDNNAPLDSSDSCEAIHDAIAEYTLAVDGFLDVLGYTGVMSPQERKVVEGAFQRANNERRQLFVLSRRYC